MPLYEPIPSTPSTPSDYSSVYPSSFPISYITTMFHKALEKAQMDFPVVTDSLSYAPKYALLQMDPLKILLQDAASAYPPDIPASND